MALMLISGRPPSWPPYTDDVAPIFKMAGFETAAARDSRAGMKRRIVLVEFSIYDQYPLVSGYLHAFAAADPDIAAEFDFVYVSKEVSRVDYLETLKALKKLNPSVLCFSCYVWNMGLVRKLVDALKVEPSIELIILGGHQVSHQITRYVGPHDSKIVVLNGQGEIPFKRLLKQLVDRSLDSGSIQGVSRFVSGELVNGGEGEMLLNLDDIPSPFLGGFFDHLKHPIGVFETNRGCPYRCSFCTWGGDTTRVTKFSLERVKDELLWLAKRPALFIYLADANWGMLPRDIEISEHIAKLKQRFGTPLMVYYAAAKNQPKGSLACIERFHEGGVITSQALGIQSMNPETLEKVDRKNIKNQAFIDLFSDLRARRIDSYCELIWPLPGETLATLKQGFDRLLELGAQTIIMYPAILINNAALTDQVIEHEMEVAQSDDWKSELQLVKRTKYASRQDVEDGLWFYYAYFLLGNCDPDKTLLKYLSAATSRSYAFIVDAFVEQLRARGRASSYFSLIDSIFGDDAHGNLMTIGRLATHLTHEERAAAQIETSCFIASQLGRPSDRAAPISLIWSLALPRLFTDTADDVEQLLAGVRDVTGPLTPALDGITVHAEAGRIELRVMDTHGAWGEAARWFGCDTREPLTCLEIQHPRADGRYQPRDPGRNHVYAHGMIQRLTHIRPRVSRGSAALVT